MQLLSYDYQSVDSLVDKLCLLYEGEISRQTLIDDYKAFLIQLQENHIVVFSEDNIDDLNKADISDRKKNSCNAQLYALTMEITDRCNERCIHCYIPDHIKSKGANISFSKFIQIVDEFAEMGGMHITITGGEITTHKQYLSMIKYCKDKGLSVGLITNLYNISNEDLSEIVKMSVDSVQVSLYSICPSIHDKITTIQGSCDKTLANINYLISRKIPVTIATPLMKTNYESFIDVLTFAKSKAINVRMEPIILAQDNFAKDKLSERLSIKEAKLIFERIAQFDLDYLKEQCFHETMDDTPDFNLLNYLNTSPCEIGKSQLCVTAKGKVTACTGFTEFIVGDTQDQTLSHIWKTSKNLNRLRHISEADFQKCVSCEYSNYCLRCVKRNYNESGGNLFALTPHFCEMAKLSKQIIEKYKKTKT